MNNKGNTGLVIAVVILAIIIMVSILVDVSSNECNANKDCSEDSYCGSDNSCHAYPDKIVIKETKNNFVPASLVIGISILLAAVILRKRTSL